MRELVWKAHGILGYLVQLMKNNTIMFTCQSSNQFPFTVAISAIAK